jgi:hypothetical protein
VGLYSSSDESIDVFLIAVHLITIVLYAQKTYHVKMAMKLCNKKWYLQFIKTCARDERGLLHHSNHSPQTDWFSPSHMQFEYPRAI